MQWLVRWVCSGPIPNQGGMDLATSTGPFPFLFFFLIPNIHSPYDLKYMVFRIRKSVRS